MRAARVASPENVTAWVASDNLLAAAALEALGSPLAARVRGALERCGGGLDGLHEVLLGYRIGAPRRPVYSVLGRVYSEALGATVVVELGSRTGRPIVDWRGYADLAVYKALDALLRGSRGRPRGSSRA